MEPWKPTVLTLAASLFQHLGISHGLLSISGKTRILHVTGTESLSWASRTSSRGKGSRLLRELCCHLQAGCGDPWLSPKEHRLRRRPALLTGSCGLFAQTTLEEVVRQDASL